MYVTDKHVFVCSVRVQPSRLCHTAVWSSYWPVWVWARHYWWEMRPVWQGHHWRPATLWAVRRMLRQLGSDHLRTYRSVSHWYCIAMIVVIIAVILMPSLWKGTTYSSEVCQSLKEIHLTFLVISGLCIGPELIMASALDGSCCTHRR